MEKIRTPWEKGLMLICQKCHKAIQPEALTSEQNSAEVLRDYLRKELALQQAGKGIRVTISGCLNVCMANKQAVAYASTTTGTSATTTECFVMHPEQDREQLLEFLKSK